MCLNSRLHTIGPVGSSENNDGNDPVGGSDTVDGGNTLMATIPLVAAILLMATTLLMATICRCGSLPSITICLAGELPGKGAEKETWRDCLRRLLAICLYVYYCLQLL